MAATTAEKKRTVSSVFRAGSGLSRTSGAPARRFGVLPLSWRSVWSSADIELRHIACDVKTRHSSQGSCSRAKLPISSAVRREGFLPSRERPLTQPSACESVNRPLPLKRSVRHNFLVFNFFPGRYFSKTARGTNKSVNGNPAYPESSGTIALLALCGRRGASCLSRSRWSPSETFGQIALERP